MFLGVPSAVDSLTLSLQNRAVFLNWTAPFTLDIPDTDPITYCVDIVNSTSSATLHSECGINVTEYTYLPPDSGCRDHVITVTPVNVVGRGQQSTILYSQAISGLVND